MDFWDDYKLLATEDGSSTLYSNHFEEACHSLQGAFSETVNHYVKACEISDKVRKNSGKISSILEVGFGTGLGYLATTKSLKENGLVDRKLQFISLEIDEKLPQWASSHYQELEGLTKGDFYGLPAYILQENSWQLIVVIGDARKTLPQLEKRTDLSFDAIYQDPFSPKKNPRLWSLQWFDLLRSLASKSCIMSTYSASSAVRKGMVTAGWKVSKGETFGSKKEATIARNFGEMEQDMIEHLQRSPLSCYQD